MREAADAARVLAGPMARGASSWGSVEELLEGTRLPAPLRADVAKWAAQRATPMQLDEDARQAALQAVAAGVAAAGSLEGEMAIGTDDLLLLVLQVRRARGVHAACTRCACGVRVACARRARGMRVACVMYASRRSARRQAGRPCV